MKIEFYDLDAVRPVLDMAAAEEQAFRVEVIVRESGIEIGNGSVVIAGIPKVDGEYDLPTLASYMLSLKRDHPDTEKASVLLEPEIPYDYLIRVMDVVRSAELMEVDQLEPAQLALFTQISIGEAP